MSQFEEYIYSRDLDIFMKGESNYLDINSNKSRTKLKWETKYSGSKMIENTIDWYKVFINEPNKIEQFSKKQILDYFTNP